MTEEQNLTRGRKTYLKRIANDFKENAHSIPNEISEEQEHLIQGGYDVPTLFEQFESTKEQIEGKKAEINLLYDSIFKLSPSGQKLNRCVLEVSVETVSLNPYKTLES